MLESAGVEYRVPTTAGATPAARERLSVHLMGALQATRQRSVLELLYRLNARSLYAFSITRVRRLEPGVDAADLVDDAFLCAFTKCAAFKVSPTATFSGWIFAVAENLARQHARRARRQVCRPAAEADDRVAETADPAVQILRDEAAAQAESDWLLFLRLCAAGVVKLPARWRKVLELRDAEGLRYDEIAARLGLRRSHVGMLVRRARLRVLQTVIRSLVPFREVADVPED